MSWGTDGSPLPLFSFPWFLRGGVQVREDLSLHPSRLWAPGGSSGSTGFWGSRSFRRVPPFLLLLPVLPLCFSWCRHLFPSGLPGPGCHHLSPQWHLSLGLCRARVQPQGVGVHFIPETAPRTLYTRVWEPGSPLFAPIRFHCAFAIPVSRSRQNWGPGMLSSARALRPVGLSVVPGAVPRPVWRPLPAPPGRAGCASSKWA